jgi:WD40 repeat protein
MDMTFDRIEEEITIHRGRVSALEFSSNGTLLASSSLDGSVVIYETQQWNEIPIKIADNDAYVWDLDFSPDGEYLITACGDGDLRIWPTRPALMAGELCQFLKENFTQEEWLKYVGNDLDYEITCDNLQIAP